MTLARPSVGIVFNASQPAAGRGDETISETSIQETAAVVHATLSAAECTAALLPVNADLLDLAERLRRTPCDLLINLCEAFRGVPQLEANVAAFFEAMGWRFTGSGPATLALCQQKFASKALLSARGLPCAPGVLLEPGDELPELELPLIVKPNAEDASLGIYADSVILDKSRLRPQVEKVWSTYRQAALVERFVDGREFNVAVLQEGAQVRALPVSEIRFVGMPAGMPHIVSYEAKWFEEHPLYRATVPECPAQIAPALAQALQNLAVRAFRALGCRDYARVDFRVAGEQEVIILEVNPNPDISPAAGYARALKVAGLDYPGFWQIMIANALGREVR